MYSAPDSLVRDQGMVESGVTEGGNKTATLTFVDEHNNTSMELKFCCNKA